MPLSLEDYRWATLKTAYRGGCGKLVDWLQKAYKSGMTEGTLGDIINEVAHQGDTSEAMYAVAPHLVALAEVASPRTVHEVLINAGLIHCLSQVPGAIQCPDDLRSEFAKSATVGREKLMALLPSAVTIDDFKLEVAALAGFMGHGRFGLVVEGVEFFKISFTTRPLKIRFLAYDPLRKPRRRMTAFTLGRSLR